MNVVSRGVKNVLRNPMRSGAIIIMLAISISLILSMLVARSSVNAKIDAIKSSTGTTITINPAGVSGFAGGGDALTTTQLTTVKNTAHISSTVATLSDQMSTDDTSLIPSLTLGNFGSRQMRFESGTNESAPPLPSGMTRKAPTPRTTVKGTTDPNSISGNGDTLVLTSGKTIDGNSSDLVAIIGSDLATKNNLSVGNTFTAYTKTITVAGIYKTGNTFQDSGVVMPLVTVQTLTEQADSINNIIAKVDNNSNTQTVITNLKTALGDKADITSDAEQATTSIASLQSISNLALSGVIGATIAGAVIILLSMVMVVRERRREIGVIKAIGGTNKSVVIQFTTEALTLTVVGSMIGLGLGVLFSGPMTTSLVSSSTTNSSSNERTIGRPGMMFRVEMNQISKNFTQVTSTLTPATFFLAINMTIIIAIIGSAIPAWFIARISPAEILRSE